MIYLLVFVGVLVGLFYIDVAWRVYAVMRSGLRAEHLEPRLFGMQMAGVVCACSAIVWPVSLAFELRRLWRQRRSAR